MKAAKFLLVVCLLAIGVMAVLSVNYPEMQESFRTFFQDAGEFIGRFIRLFTEPFRQALVEG